MDEATEDRHRAGDRTRREVMGDQHVDQVHGRTHDFDRAFQELVTDMAWGAVWARPDLDRRTRSLLTITCSLLFGMTNSTSICALRRAWA